MTLASMLLERIADWSPPADGGRDMLSLTDPASRAQVQVLFDRVDSMSAQVTRITVRRPHPGTGSMHALASALAARITGLMEALKLLECDEAAGKALLRSNQPAAREQDLLYYEVALARQGAELTATVERYRGSHQASRRDAVSFVLTREALAKLVGDLAATA